MLKAEWRIGTRVHATAGANQGKEAEHQPRGRCAIADREVGRFRRARCASGAMPSAAGTPAVPDRGGNAPFWR